MYLKFENSYFNANKITWYEANLGQSKRVKLVFDNGLSQILDFENHEELKNFIQALEKANT